MIDLFFATIFYTCTYIVRISQNRKPMWCHNLLMLLIFAVMHSVFQPKGTKPKSTKGSCQEKGNFCKTPFSHLFQSHSVACFGSVGLEEARRSATLCETLPPRQLPPTTAQFAGLEKALVHKRTTKVPATGEGVRTRKAYLCKLASSVAARHRRWSPCQVCCSITRDTVCRPSDRCWGRGWCL